LLFSTGEEGTESDLDALPQVDALRQRRPLNLANSFVLNVHAAARWEIIRCARNFGGRQRFNAKGTSDA
jgi:hypothetical protein